MRKLIFIVASFILLAFYGCTKMEGDPVTKEFSINGSYTELQVEDAFDVTVSDEVSQITVTAGENVMPKIVVEKSGCKLIIRVKPVVNIYGTVKVLLPYSPDLTTVDLSGASNFNTGFALKGEKVEVSLSGASNFFGDVEADEAEIDLSGASDAAIQGKVGKLTIDLSGSSDAYVHCDGSIKVSVSGSSKLHYTGNASTTDCSTSGSSGIVHDVF